MPLSEKARIEVYLPDVESPAYLEFLAALEREFSHAFGGCSVVRGIDGSYLSRVGVLMRDRVNLLYADAPLGFKSDFALLSDYTDEECTKSQSPSSAFDVV